MIIAVGGSLLLSTALLRNGLGLRLGLGILGSYLVGLGLNLGLLSTASFLGLLNGRLNCGLIIDLRLYFGLLGPTLLLGSLSFDSSFILSLGLWLGFLGPAFLLGSLGFDGGFLISFGLWLDLLASSLSLGSFDRRSIFVVVGLLLGFALLGLLSGRGLSRLLLFFLSILTTLLAATLLGRLLGGGITTVLGSSALDCMHARMEGHAHTCSSAFSASGSVFFLVARPRMPDWPRTLYSGSPLKSSSAILPSIIAVRTLAWSSG